MKASELMTRDPACCTPEDSIQRAAELMKDCDCGCIPVVESTNSKKLSGVVTDRDLAVRALAQGKGPETKVRDVMTREVSCCTPDDDVAAVEQIMTREQVRRVPVVDTAGNCCGMISQADLALNNRAASDKDVGRVVERISEPVG